jgi:hypothetical protein
MDPTTTTMALAETDADLTQLQMAPEVRRKLKNRRRKRNTRFISQTRKFRQLE